jgi:hypothetical protein
MKSVSAGVSGGFGGRYSWVDHVGGAVSFDAGTLTVRRREGNFSVFGKDVIRRAALQAEDGRDWKKSVA